jgi:hypothetical protein
MDTADKYVAIEDLMKHMFSTHHMCMPGEETDWYTYSGAPSIGNTSSNKETNGDGNSTKINSTRVYGFGRFGGIRF